MSEDEKIKRLESRNLKLEFEISRLNRDNARLHAEIGFLRGRGVKLLMHEIIHKVDSKITNNLKKLNKPSVGLVADDELNLVEKSHSRADLLKIAQSVDLKAYYVIPKANLAYRIPMIAYKTAFNSFLLGGRVLWRGWSKAKKSVKKVVK
ncbi:MAG TPA: hypothetical protein VLA77_00875 [Candidatus Saccharimonadales bacterium]|nr:hypothetical protein [Candidatus Saccharimonadales bacterium]